MEHAKIAGLEILCGVSGYEDAKDALLQGANGLKFYPSHRIRPDELRSIIQKLRAEGLLPSGTQSIIGTTNSYLNLHQSNSVPILVSGGVDTHNIGDYLRAGATGFAIGVDYHHSNRKKSLQKFALLQSEVEACLRQGEDRRTKHRTPV
jgi:2-keto-3-deoxy-6-phosphogluconate aldolase